MKSINPYSGELIREFEEQSWEGVERQLDRSRVALPRWRQTGVDERAACAAKLANALRSDAQRLGKLITQEMGKPIRQSREEVEKCALMCDYYAKNAEALLADEAVKTDYRKSYVAFEPLGVILGIMPWNYPFWQALRWAVPALTAGNVCLLKHSSNVPMCALELEETFKKAGYPDDAFKTLLIGAAKASKLVEDCRVDAVSLTGSDRTGAQIAELAGKWVKKLVLELGGSDPFIVLEDADVDKAAADAVKSRIGNAGQSCNSAKRFIVMGPVAERFKEKFIENLKKLKVGDPMSEDTDIGPMAKEDIKADLEAQLSDAVSKGAEVLRPHQAPKGRGYFFAPCVVTNTKPGMRIVTEEVFGPIAPIIVVEDEEEAIRVANGTAYGLGASIWSRDPDRAERVARRIQAGIIAVNKMVRSDPRMPFGGVLRSGYGRELGTYGIKEFVNIKSVIIND